MTIHCSNCKSMIRGHRFVMSPNSFCSKQCEHEWLGHPDYKNGMKGCEKCHVAEIRDVVVVKRK